MFADCLVLVNPFINILWPSYNIRQLPKSLFRMAKILFLNWCTFSSRCDSSGWEYKRKRYCTKQSNSILSSQVRVCVCVFTLHPHFRNLLMHSQAWEDQSDEPLTSGWPTRQARSRRDPSVHLCDALMQVLAVLVYPKRMYRRPSGIIPIWRLSCVSGVRQGCGGGGGWGKGLLAWLQREADKAIKRLDKELEDTPFWGERRTEAAHSSLPSVGAK